jgi:hypothetical protein
MFPVLAMAVIAAAMAGCSETTGSTSAPKAAAVAPARSDSVDPGQPIVLTGTSQAGQTDTAVVTAGAAPAGQQAAAENPVPRPSPKVAAVQQTAEPMNGPARAASAIVEPSAADILAPEPQADGVTAVPDDGASEAPAAVISDAPPAAPAAPAGNEAISASAKAKLIGELQALKKRPGAEGTATKARCPEGSLEPECLAAAD